MNYYLTVLKKYAVFSGRAQRAEYWYFALFNLIISIVLSIIDRAVGAGAETGMGMLSTIYSLAVLIPGIAVSIRRLHDTDRSGWWLFISLIPLVGIFILLFFLIQDSQADQNQYGPNPKETGQPNLNTNHVSSPDNSVERDSQSPPSEPI